MNLNKLNSIWNPKNKGNRIKVGIPLAPGDNSPTIFLNEKYFSYVHACGYEPIPISFYTAPETLSSLDMLLLPGGTDINPLRYLEYNTNSFNVNDVRDEFEIRILHHFLREGKPIFGICRGLQLIFREFTKSTGQEYGIFRFSQGLNHLANSDLKISRGTAIQLCQLSPDLIGQTDGLGCIVYQINSLHHQGVYADIDDLENYLETFEEDCGDCDTAYDIPTVASDFNGEIFPHKEGDDLHIKGYTIDEDNDVLLVEAFDIESLNIRAVQWHPEEMGDYLLLQTFVEKFFPRDKTEKEL